MPRLRSRLFVLVVALSVGLAVAPAAATTHGAGSAAPVPPSVGASATNLKHGVVDALRPWAEPQRPGGKQASVEISDPLLDDVDSDAATGYLDGRRLLDPAAAAGAYQHDAELLVAIAADLGSGEGDATVLGQAAGDVVAASRSSVEAAIGDLAVLLGGSRDEPLPAVDSRTSFGDPVDPGASWKALQSASSKIGTLFKDNGNNDDKSDSFADNRLRQARVALARADLAWADGENVTALVYHAIALDQVWRAFRGFGIDPFGDQDRDGLPDGLELVVGSDPRNTDSDGDGLGDHYELFETYPVHDPSNGDTDGDGLGDGGEDVDGDGLDTATESAALTNPLEPDSDFDGLGDAEELALGTDPLHPDTDGDGLEDGVEVEIGSDPLNADTDGDGTGDAEDTHTVDAAGPGGVTAEITGVGANVAGASIEEVEDGSLTGAPGQLGPPLDFTTDGPITEAELTFPYDPATVGDPADLAIFFWDEAAGEWVVAADVMDLDTADNTISATVDHFSIFALFNIRDWLAFWANLEEICSGGDPGEVSAVDVVLTIDSSGSMSWNDPSGLRRVAAKEFVDGLIEGDRAAVVDFDSFARLFQGLTDDKVALKAAIDRINSSGGTNLGRGVRLSLDHLLALGREDALKAVILLTDGQGSWDNSLIGRAVAEEVIIFTIGLGSGVDDALLQAIADGTGGQYFPVADASDLSDVFERIGGEIGDRDTDEDGIPDCDEIGGLYNGKGVGPIFTDPENPDTDGDGLEDGEEAGEKFELQGPYGGGIGKFAYRLWSDPTKQDTDGDGLLDPGEFDYGTDAWRAHSDGDDLSDGVEVDQVGSDPLLTDTDGDQRDDGWEVDNADGGFDPLIFDEEQSIWSYAKDFGLGALCGEWLGICERDSIAWLAGNITGGIFVVTDILGAISNVFRGEFVSAGLNVLGAIPLGGDALSVVTKGIKFIKRVPRRALDAIRHILDFDEVPLALRKTLLDGVTDGAATRLATKEFSDEAIARIARSRVPIEHLDEVVDGSKTVRRSPAWYGRESHAEDYLAGITPGAKRQEYFPDPNRPPNVHPNKGSRRVDVWNPATRQAIEVKRGYIRATDFIKEQVAKDVKLRQAGEFSSVEWHFFPSIKGQIGPDPDLLALLKANNIEYVIYSP